jgi:ATP-dependent helicase IRC3
MYQSFDLKEIRNNNLGFIPQRAFEHQKDAFAMLSKVFDFQNDEHKSGILVLPTGAGKTFTSVDWICRNVLPKNHKVLWLAQTGHLLKQAFQEFSKSMINVPHSRERINIRAVASSAAFANANQIEVSDDVLIITTQTALNKYNSKAKNVQGLPIKTKFEEFVEQAKSTGLFLVLDEAHHAPAFGSRNLLIGGDKFETGLKQLIPNIYFLGLTATPTYTDSSKRGWLWEIFSTDVEHIDKKGKKNIRKGIIYEAEKSALTEAGILALPKFIQRNTGETFDVDDKTYASLVREHKDLPEWLVEKMAKDEKRNNSIASEYILNKSTYGKTIIFADRWFQCIDIKEKLLKEGIKVDAVYSHLDAVPGSQEERNNRTSTENDIIIENFKQNKLDVILNVKMLTEGTDVPDVKTVFITRQTTSSISLTQMIGRALRGTKSQKNEEKKDTANIVFFTDNWKRIINFADPELGGLSEGKKVRGVYPIEYISIKLVEELARKIDTGINISEKPFLSFLPLGWYETEVTIAIGDELTSFTEFVIVSEGTEKKFERFINHFMANPLSEWGDENLSEEIMNKVSVEWISEYFMETDNLEGTLDMDIIKLARHIAQNKTLPKFTSFAERNDHDLSKLASAMLNMTLTQIDDELYKEFHKTDKLWNVFYKDFRRFNAAFDSEKGRVLYFRRHGNNPEFKIEKPEIILQDREPSDEIKEKVFKHDQYTCQCCGLVIDPNSKRDRKLLQIDHISAYTHSGDSSESNLQTLCMECNNYKSINEINFRITKSKLLGEKEIDLDCLQNGDMKNIEKKLRRMINNFYFCKAVLDIKLSEDRRGKYYTQWEIELYSGNNPDWLKANIPKILNFIQNILGFKHIETIQIL